MYNQKNSEQKGGAPPMSPRISFSNDFVDSSSSSSSHQHQMRTAYRDAPVSSDFEFSVSNYSMMTADELFFKGRLFPLKETRKTTTLREELRHHDGGGQPEEEEDDSGSFSLRPPKNPTRWKGFLGLRKSHIGSKKSDKSVDKRTAYHHDDVQCSKNSSQDYDD